jgi:hypothetical protein
MFRLAVVQRVDRFSGGRGSLVQEIGICEDILHSCLENKALALTSRITVTWQGTVSLRLSEDAI